MNSVSSIKLPFDLTLANMERVNPDIARIVQNKLGVGLPDFRVLLYQGGRSLVVEIEEINALKLNSEVSLVFLSIFPGKEKYNPFLVIPKEERVSTLDIKWCELRRNAVDRKSLTRFDSMLALLEEARLSGNVEEKSGWFHFICQEIRKTFNPETELMVLPYLIMDSPYTSKLVKFMICITRDYGLQQRWKDLFQDFDDVSSLINSIKTNSDSFISNTDVIGALSQFFDKNHANSDAAFLKGYWSLISNKLIRPEEGITSAREAYQRQSSRSEYTLLHVLLKKIQNGITLKDYDEVATILRKNVIPTEFELSMVVNCFLDVHAGEYPVGVTAKILQELVKFCSHYRVSDPDLVEALVKWSSEDQLPGLNFDGFALISQMLDDLSHAPETQRGQKIKNILKEIETQFNYTTALFASPLLCLSNDIDIDAVMFFLQHTFDYETWIDWNELGLSPHLEKVVKNDVGSFLTSEVKEMLKGCFERFLLNEDAPAIPLLKMLWKNTLLDFDEELQPGIKGYNERLYQIFIQLRDDPSSIEAFNSISEIIGKKWLSKNEEILSIELILFLKSYVSQCEHGNIPLEIEIQPSKNLSSIWNKSKQRKLPTKIAISPLLVELFITHYRNNRVQNLMNDLLKLGKNPEVSFTPNSFYQEYLTTIQSGSLQKKGQFLKKIMTSFKSPSIAFLAAPYIFMESNSNDLFLFLTEISTIFNIDWSWVVNHLDLSGFIDAVNRNQWSSRQISGLEKIYRQAMQNYDTGLVGCFLKAYLSDVKCFSINPVTAAENSYFATNWYPAPEIKVLDAVIRTKNNAFDSTGYESIDQALKDSSANSYLFKLWLDYTSKAPKVNKKVLEFEGIDSRQMLNELADNACNIMLSNPHSLAKTAFVKMEVGAYTDAYDYAERARALASNDFLFLGGLTTIYLTLADIYRDHRILDQVCDIYDSMSLDVKQLFVKLGMELAKKHLDESCKFPGYFNLLRARDTLENVIDFASIQDKKFMEAMLSYIELRLKPRYKKYEELKVDMNEPFLRNINTKVKAIQALQSGDWDAIQQIIQKPPPNFLFGVIKSIFLIHEQNYQEAQRLLIANIEQIKNDPESWLLLRYLLENNLVNRNDFKDEQQWILKVLDEKVEPILPDHIVPLNVYLSTSSPSL